MASSNCVRWANIILHLPAFLIVQLGVSYGGGDSEKRLAVLAELGQRNVIASNTTGPDFELLYERTTRVDGQLRKRRAILQNANGAIRCVAFDEGGRALWSVNGNRVVAPAQDGGWIAGDKIGLRFSCGPAKVGSELGFEFPVDDAVVNVDISAFIRQLLEDEPALDTSLDSLTNRLFHSNFYQVNDYWPGDPLVAGASDNIDVSNWNGGVAHGEIDDDPDVQGLIVTRVENHVNR